MKNNIFKRGVSLFLALVMSLSALMGFGTTAFAAGEKQKVYMVFFPRSGDGKFNADWGHGAFTFMNGWATDSSTHTTLRSVGSYEGQICYCIEPGVGQKSGDTLTKWDENFWDNYPSEYNHTIAPDDIKILIGRIFQYGYTGNLSTSWQTQNGGGDKIAQACATQLLIWETVVGERDAYFNKVSTGGKSPILSLVNSNHPMRSQILGYYGSIERNVQNHSKLPSFFAKSPNKAQNTELEWNGSEYTATLIDQNNVLSSYTFSSDNSDLHFSTSGNTLTITAKTAPSKPAVITASKKNSQRRGLVTWTDEKIGPNGGIQDVITYTESVNDPVQGFLNVKVSYGSAKIVKTSEDSKVDGVSFRVQGNGMNKTVQTGKNGEIQINNLTPGIYIVTEQTADRYIPQETRRVTVVSGQTATVTFNNVLKRGELKVTKTSEDGICEGVKFHLSGMSLSGLKVDEYAVTDSSGVATFQDVLIGTGYVLSEVDTDVKYVVPEQQTAAVEWNKVTDKSFYNVLKKFHVTVTKLDAEIGTPQGDGSLAGAVYGIYKGGQLVDTYTTDRNGQFTTKDYVCGTDWTVREIHASDGYLVNDTSYAVGADPKLYTVEYNRTALDVTETVRKGKISVLKHCDDGRTQIETPEKGTEFKVFLKSAGSYDAAKESERDFLICDENGYAETKALPYGTYTVRQTKGWDGNELLPAFDVFVSEDGKVYRYLINNSTFQALVEIVKKDMETDKVIPAAGIGFKVRNTDTGEYIVQHINYPTPMDLDTYYTDSTGKLMLPQALPFGHYEIIEQQTAYGYVLDKTPVPFTVDGTQPTVTVEKHNIAQKGTITVSKSGEVFASVTESDGCYQPVYAAIGLKGAVYEVYAAEDIVTPDGTIRAKKGELAGTLETDENGDVTGEPLCLGKYEVREVQAPYGMVRNEAPQIVELIYAGQEVELTCAYTSFYNERQKVQVDVVKNLEQDAKFGIGMNDEILAVSFGLYAAEDLTAADGKVIPKGGLIEIASCNKDGKAVFQTDLPVGAKLYIKEYSTDKHYLVSDKIYPVTFEYVGQDVGQVHLSANGGEAIQNKLIRGKICGKKSDENGAAVSGALLGLFSKDETEFTKAHALMTAVSEKDGSFCFSDVPYGSWIVREIEAPDGYALNDERYSVTVDEDGACVSVQIVDRKIPVAEIPKTGDGRNPGFWIGLGAVGVGGLISSAIICFKKKRDEDEE